MVAPSGFDFITASAFKLVFLKGKALKLHKWKFQVVFKFLIVLCLAGTVIISIFQEAVGWTELSCLIHKASFGAMKN